MSAPTRCSAISGDGCGPGKNLEHAERKLQEVSGNLDRASYVKRGAKRQKAIAQRGRKLFRMSVAGMYRLGVKGSLGPVGSTLLPLLCEAPVKRWAAVKCERLLNSNLLSQSRAWYSLMYQNLSCLKQVLLGPFGHHGVHVHTCTCGHTVVRV